MLSKIRPSATSMREKHEEDDAADGSAPHQRDAEQPSIACHNSVTNDIAWALAIVPRDKGSPIGPPYWLSSLTDGWTVRR